jgi:hypothetical protein
MKLRTVKEAVEYSGLPAKLINAVIRQLGGKDRLADIYLHGVDGGYPGFTYYTDTVAFYKRHKAAINALLFEQADELGEDPVQMVLRWRCIAGEAPKAPKAPKDETKEALAKYHDQLDYFRTALHDRATDQRLVGQMIYGGPIREEHTQVCNGLAWFAAEEVARAVVIDE